METSPEEKLKEDYKLLKEATPNVRWNWDDRRYYHITKKELYEMRFDLFKAFYNDFFLGIRELPKNVEKESYIIECKRILNWDCLVISMLVRRFKNIATLQRSKAYC